MLNRHPLEIALLARITVPDIDIERVKELLKEIEESEDIPKPSINAQFGNGNTVLLRAINTEGNLAVVKLLLEEKADPEIKNNDGSNVLMHAAKNGYLDIIESLIKVKANINIMGSKCNVPALSYAAYNGHVNAVQLLIKAECNIELRSNEGPFSFNSKTALDFALLCKNHTKHFPVIRTLLEAGARINNPKPLAEFLLTQSCPTKDFEDKYVSLSILCEQQERIREEKSNQVMLSEELYQKAENMLASLPEPSSVTYNSKRNAIIEKINEVTNQIFPVFYPQEITQIMAKYDNPLRHRLFDPQEKQKGTELKEDGRYKRKFASI